ncbi:MAG TPA: hypothetical protein ENK60_01835 [Anaerolineae bacterium]|nr:hypothetical protein [Anaerolineae bacterium]
MFRTILAILGIIFAILIVFFLLSDRERVSTTPLNINLEEIKPPEWKPYLGQGLALINIDHDIEPEWLFLYRDGYSGNQIGGVIYDAQNRPRGDRSIPIASQVPTYLVPYKLLPDYPSSKNKGYLGDKGVDYQTTGKQDVRTPVPQDEKTPASAEVKNRGDRLLIRGYRYQRGGDPVVNRFAVFGWVSPEYGYSGALAYTPGWFSLRNDDPGDWGQWTNAPRDIVTLWAWEPQVDRSNICRVAEWRFQPGTNPPMTWHFLSRYEESFLRFCQKTIPTEPAFPEGQVMAYLLDGNKARWKDANQARTYTDVQIFAITEPEITDQPFENPIAPVDVDFRAHDGFHSMRWLVQMIPPSTIKDPVRWRILRADDR